jgi:hypothetical protein
MISGTCTAACTRDRLLALRLDGENRAVAILLCRVSPTQLEESYTIAIR